MTEAEWLGCANPEQMPAALGRKASRRKRRLFACACYYGVWPLMTDERSRAALLAAEQFADRLIGESELERRERAARVACSDPCSTSSAYQARGACRCVAQNHAGKAVSDWQHVVWAKQWAKVEERGIKPGHPDFHGILERAEREELAEQAVLVRDIFGNPFRKVQFDKDWLTDTAVSLASQMHESRDFSAMPILADALQDARCENDDILSHCRGPGPHVRGCWVVDLLLGTR